MVVVVVVVVAVAALVALGFVSNNFICKIFFQIMFTMPLRRPPRLVLAPLVLLYDYIAL